MTLLNSKHFSISVVFVLVAAILASLTISSGAQAAPKAYKNCAELNKTYKYGVSAKAKPKNVGAQAIFTPAVNLAVFNKNKKLDTDRDSIVCEVIRKVATPATSMAPSNDTALAYAKPLQTCKLQEMTNQTGAGAKGFPTRQSVTSLGEIKVAVLPVDFSNAVGQGNPDTLYRDDVTKIEDWGRFFSRGKMNYKVEFKANSWLRAPKGAEWYTCLECQKGAREQKQPQQEALQQLVDVADPSYDFTSTKFLYFVFPYEAEKQFGTALFSHRSILQTKEGPITVAAYGEMGGGVGAVADRTTIWDHAVHEFLHFQGFIGHGPENASDYYISTNQWGGSKAVTSWEAFLNGWFGIEEILCLDKSDITKSLSLTLDSIDDFGSLVESLMIRIDESQLLIVELRENGPFTNFSVCSMCQIPFKPGFTAYRVNVNGVHYRNDADPNGSSKNFWSYIKEDNRAVISTSIEFAGIKITRTGTNQLSISPVG
jgi:hypothetical protein